MVTQQNYFFSSLCIYAKKIFSYPFLKIMVYMKINHTHQLMIKVIVKIYKNNSKNFRVVLFKNLNIYDVIFYIKS